jgi:2-dehydropantoate 2-reductase
MTDDATFDPRSFAVIGAGPVGCILAAFLAKGGFDVTLCDVVPELVAPVVDRGIILEGAETLQQAVSRTCLSVDELADINPDVIFITVKANTLPLIASAIEDFYQEHMAVVSWQNGIDTELEIARSLGRTTVMRAVVNYGCSLLGPAHVKIPFHHPPHYIQQLNDAGKAMAISITQTLTQCGLQTDHTDQIVSMVWRKSIMNACMNPVCAMTGLTMAQVMGDPIIFQIVDALVKECIKVARANEINLGWDYYTHAIDYMRHAGDHKPSMLMDIENRRRTEIDFINGKFVEYGGRAGIQTPFNATLKSLVKGLESQF